MIFAIQIKK